MKKTRKELSIVIPTYNEKENIFIIIQKLISMFKENRIKGEIIIVDDNSQDGTGEIVENQRRKYKNVRIIHRKEKLGLSSAVLDGFKICRGEIFGAMDADLSHPAEKIPEMFSLIKKNEYDFVIGSRYVPGSGIRGWGLRRKLMSKVATMLARPLTRVKDPMSGFFLIKKECIKNRKFDSKGFKILLEFLVKAKYKKLKEIPIIFTNRTKGKSKAGSSEIAHYLKNLGGYFKFKYLKLR